MKRATEKKPSAKAKPNKEQFHFFDSENFWIAHGLNAQHSGMLFFSKTTEEYSVIPDESSILFPRLARARYTSQEACPLDQHGKPKAEFLILLTIRDRIATTGISRFTKDNWLWRRHLLRGWLHDAEKTAGLTPSAEFPQALSEVVTDDEKFENFIGKWLVGIVCGDGAGKNLHRLASWIDRIEKLEAEGVPANYQRFFRAVEEAARNAQGIPTQKAVRTIFEKGLSANQLGAGTEFDTLKTRLGYEWLPAAKREPSRRAR